MKSIATFSGLAYWLEEIKSVNTTPNPCVITMVTNLFHIYIYIQYAPETFQKVLVGLGGDDSDNEVGLDMAKQFAKEHALTLVIVDINNTQQVIYTSYYYSLAKQLV